METDKCDNEARTAVTGETSQTAQLHRDRPQLDIWLITELPPTLAKWDDRCKGYVALENDYNGQSAPKRTKWYVVCRLGSIGHHVRYCPSWT